MITRKTLVELVEKDGFTINQYGNWQKTYPSGTVKQIKISDKYFRVDKRYSVPDYAGKPINKWLRISGGYLSKVSIKDGRLVRG